MTDFTPRPYATIDDLSKILKAVGIWNAQTDFCGYLHPGDVAHLITNGLRGNDPAQHIFLVEDAQGELLAVVFVYRAVLAGFGVVVHPAHRGSELESALIQFGEQKAWAVMQAAGSDRDSVSSDAMDCDPIRADILSRQGYQPGEPLLHCTTRSLLDPIPESVLPEGFSIRNAEGLHEADALGVVHSSAFGSNWQPGEYRKVMQAPGFHIDRELVVVAPDGRFAAFLIYWLDPISQSALFEPVGCHAEFQRKGLTRALMYEGMRRMVAHGMTTAIVNHETPQENPASSALYASVGFKPKHVIYDYRKTMK